MLGRAHLHPILGRSLRRRAGRAIIRLLAAGVVARHGRRIAAHAEQRWGGHVDRGAQAAPAPERGARPAGYGRRERCHLFGEPGRELHLALGDGYLETFEPSGALPAARGAEHGEPLVG